MYPLPQEMPPLAGVELSQVQKAAVVIRLLVMGGADPGISALPPCQQRRLVREMSALRLVDRTTLARTVSEFSEQLDRVGLHFPREVDRLLKTLDGALSRDVVDGLLAESGGDPALLGAGAWDEIASRDEDGLLALIADESDEVCAIVLTKLPPARAARLLGALPPERAQSVSRILGHAQGMSAEASSRIGAALGAVGGGGGISPAEAAQNIAAILNAATAATRSDVLDRIAEVDAVFAERVRAAVFGWEHIPERLDPRDVPKVLRALDEGVAETALAPEPDGPVAEFLLGAISSRLADQMREAINEMSAPDPAAAEQAMSAAVEAIRTLEEEGGLSLRSGPG
jgi:flagellar motor switch protein FliG